MRPRRPDPITVTYDDHAADPQRYSRLVSTGVVVTLTKDGVPRMQLSNGGACRQRECRTCGEWTDIDDEAAEDAHDW